MTYEEILSKLCYNDLRNPDGVAQYRGKDWGYDEEDYEGLGNYSKLNCGCDNCYYGRAELAEFILTLKQEDKQ